MHKIYLYVTSDGVMGIIINHKCGNSIFHWTNSSDVFPDNYEL